MKRGHDQRLPVLARQACDEAGLTFADIDQYAVCIGPGSFTGIRVGVAFARGLALANNSQAIGVTSLEALLGEAPEMPVLALLSARQRPPDQSFWAQAFCRASEDSAPEELDASLVSARAGPDTKLVTTADTEALVKTFVPEADILIRNVSASGVARWAMHSDAAHRRTPSPLYVRAPDAIPARSPLSKA
jgi:tRNA threonylcarbamoyladenosine biosynthesis protein TsaB